MRLCDLVKLPDKKVFVFKVNARLSQLEGEKWKLQPPLIPPGIYLGKIVRDQVVSEVPMKDKDGWISSSHFFRRLRLYRISSPEKVFVSIELESSYSEFIIGNLELMSDSSE